MEPGIPGEKAVRIELSDFKTREVVDVMEVDAVLVATGRSPFTEVGTHPLYMQEEQSTGTFGSVSEHGRARYRHLIN